MINAKNAHFWQIDHKVRQLLGVEGVVVLPSFEAWEEMFSIFPYARSIMCLATALQQRKTPLALMLITLSHSFPCSSVGAAMEM